jgi:hypothetical protein
MWFWVEAQKVAKGCGSLCRNFCTRSCPNLERRKVCVYHREPSVSKLELTITLCAGCHAIVERTQMVLGKMTPLLLILWREKHPGGQEKPSLPLDAELPRVAKQLKIPVEILP